MNLKGFLRPDGRKALFFVTLVWFYSAFFVFVPLWSASGGILSTALLFFVLLVFQAYFLACLYVRPKNRVNFLLFLSAVLLPVSLYHGLDLASVICVEYMNVAFANKPDGVIYMINCLIPRLLGILYYLVSLILVFIYLFYWRQERKTP